MEGYSRYTVSAKSKPSAKLKSRWAGKCQDKAEKLLRKQK